MLTGFVFRKSRSEGIGELSSALEQSLGPFGYQWLCACAIFPNLRLPLTIHIGRELAHAVGRNEPDETDLLAICQLPWFRKGWMPDDLRLRLIAGLRPEFREPVRLAIEGFLLHALAQSPPLGGQPLPASRLTNPADWRRALIAWLDRPRADGVDEDRIFIGWARGYGPGTALYYVTSNLRKIARWRILSILDLTSFIALLVTIASAFSLWVYFSSSITPVTPPPQASVSQSAPSTASEQRSVTKQPGEQAPQAAIPPPASLVPPPPAPPAPAPPLPHPVYIVFFDQDKYNITPEAMLVLEAAAERWKVGAPVQSAPVQIKVTGYDDLSSRSPGYSQRLSERRANAVAAVLEKLGVPRKDLIVAGRGQNDPRVPTPLGESEPQNRRVEVVFPYVYRGPRMDPPRH